MGCASLLGKGLALVLVHSFLSAQRRLMVVIDYGQLRDEASMAQLSARGLERMPSGLTLILLVL